MEIWIDRYMSHESAVRYQLSAPLSPWWRNQMKTFSALLALCAGNSPEIGDYPAQRPVMRSFDIFFDLRLNRRLSKQPWGWWFEPPSWSVWRHFNDFNWSGDMDKRLYVTKISGAFSIIRTFIIKISMHMHIICLMEWTVMLLCV